jgi:hypothetical protein
MKNLIQDFKNGISICFIGVTGWPSEITDIKQVNGGYSISCDGGTYFSVTSDRIFYSKAN